MKQNSHLPESHESSRRPKKSHFYGEDMNNLNEYCEKNEGSCSSTNGGPVVSASRDTGGDSDFDPEFVKKQVNLTQRVAKEVGEVTTLQNVHFERQLEMKALSINPAIFEIAEFLSDEECMHLRKMALEEGLKDSVTHKHEDDMVGQIRIMDVDGNMKLTTSEMMLTLENSFDIYFGDEDVLQMYRDLRMDKNEDGIIERDELQSIRPDAMIKYLKKITKEKPVKQSRFSKQAWLFPSESHDKIFKGIQDRVQRLTQLPEILIRKSDFQVVNYGPDGHYNAHIDSGYVGKEMPCCYRGIPSNIRCRICRFMTVLFYLNDVEEGGGTAFPVAGNLTYNETELRTSHKINLHRYCEDANLVVQPERGKAIMWYNHKVDENTGWLGKLDEMTWHGGCPVVKGEKWIANFWIKTTEDRTFDLRSL